MTPPEPSSNAGRQTPEPWITKQQLADHLSVTRRWIDPAAPRPPLPAHGSMNRYRISEVEAWLRKHYGSPAYKEN
jgi:hypothetical protein